MSDTAQTIVSICAIWGAAAYIRCFHLQHQINKLKKRLDGFLEGSQETAKPEESHLKRWS